MANATTAATTAEQVDINSKVSILKTSEVAYKKRFASIDITTAKVENAANTVGMVPAGYFAAESTGLDVDNKTGDGSIKWVTHGGKILKSVSLAAVTAVTQEGAFFWCSDNQTPTITPVEGVIPHGYVHRFISSGTVDLYFFSPNEVKQMQAFGGPFRTFTTRVDSVQMAGTAKLTLTKWKCNFKGKVISSRAVCTFDDSGAAGAQTLSLEIDGVAVTGGAITVDKDDTQGEVLSGTAITAANDIDHASELSLVMNASGTGYTASQPMYYDVQVVCLVEG